MKSFYVYVLLDPRKPGEYVYDDGEYDFQYQPFYIGKGKGKRAWDHVMEAKQANGNRHPIKVQYIRGMISDGVDPIIIKVHTSLTEDEAFALEAHLISLIGRKDLDLGPLTNMCDGGEGQTGLVHSKETKRQISQAVKDYRAKYPNPFAGKKHTPETRALLSQRWQERKERGYKQRSRFGEENSNYGNRWSDQQRARMSEARKGKTLSEEQKAAISKGLKIAWEKDRDMLVATRASKTWKITSPDGQEYTITNLAKFCREQGWANHVKSVFSAYGEWRGWTAERVNDNWKYDEAAKERVKNKGKQWRLISPDGQEFVTGNLHGTCSDLGLSRSAYSNLTSYGKWRGWTAEGIKTNGAVRPLRE